MTSHFPVQPRAKNVGGYQKHIEHLRARWWLVLAIIFAAGAIVLLTMKLGLWSRLVTTMEDVSPALTLLLMALLPIGGFSIGVVYAVAGLKFGLVGGGVAIAAVTSVHLVAIHWVARGLLRKPITRFLEKRDSHMPATPPGTETLVAATVALVPGPPYFLRNYGLALSDIPLKKYFWVCLLVYVVRSYITLALGDLSGDPSRSGFVWLGVIVAVKLTLCALLIRHIRRKQHARAENTSLPNGPGLKQAGGMAGS